MDQGVAVSTMFCPECGRKVTSDEKFCRVCGKGLQEGTPASMSAAESAATPSTGITPALAVEQADQSKKTDTLLAVRIVLLIGAGISAFTAPMFVTLLLGVAWLVVMFIPKKDAQS
jgi:uncharacterized membrane protein YvbJ